MAVITQTLIDQLSPYGTVIIAGINNPKSYIVAMENVTGTLEEIESVTNQHILTEYPAKGESSLVDGVFKTIYFK